MKIPGGENNDKRAPEALERKKLDNTGRALANGANPNPGEPRKIGQALKPVETGEDLVNVSGLGALLNQELNPSAMAAERRQKIENLKRQLREGTYNSDPMMVAKAMNEELSLEILMQGDAKEDKDLLG